MLVPEPRGGRGRGSCYLASCSHISCRAQWTLLGCVTQPQESPAPGCQPSVHCLSQGCPTVGSRAQALRASLEAGMNKRAFISNSVCRGPQEGQALVAGMPLPGSSRRPMDPADHSGIPWHSLFLRRALTRFRKPRICCVAEDDFGFPILLLLPPQGYDYRLALPCTASGVLGIKPRALGMPGEHSAH